MTGYGGASGWAGANIYETSLLALESVIRATAPRKNVEITDEASAMEYSGARPRLVHGHADNIKITVPEDLALAELFLREQERESR